MCGIAGSDNLEKAYNLYKLNLPRGSQSSGFLAVGDSGTFTHKSKETFELNVLNEHVNKLPKTFNFRYFLFHSRAPTNSTETVWNINHTHPFSQGSWHVAHNGIITNFKNFDDSIHFDVDSSIIPYHLDKLQNIKEVYSRYQGLLTSWVVSGSDIFVVKAGSSLWKDDNSFSSSEFSNSSYVDDDGIYFKLHNNSFVKEGEFNYTNPYFI
jgi:predicted glutamine amidotransferase